MKWFVLLSTAFLVVVAHANNTKKLESGVIYADQDDTDGKY